MTQSHAVAAGLKGPSMVIHKNWAPLGLLIGLVFPSCDGPNQPSLLRPSGLEIHYTRSGGWIDTSQLDVFPDGLVKACEFQHATRSVMRGDSAYISSRQMDHMSKLFDSFPQYDRRYEPPAIVMDQDRHRIICMRQGLADTVDIYMPSEARCPANLMAILCDLQTVWEWTLSRGAP